MNKCITKTDVSIGVAVKSVGHRLVYMGKILKPWTWLLWERMPVIEPVRVDHASAVVGCAKFHAEKGGLRKVKLPGVVHEKKISAGFVVLNNEEFKSLLFNRAE